MYQPPPPRGALTSGSCMVPSPSRNPNSRGQTRTLTGAGLMSVTGGLALGSAGGSPPPPAHRAPGKPPGGTPGRAVNSRLQAKGGGGGGLPMRVAVAGGRGMPVPAAPPAWLGGGGGGGPAAAAAAGRFPPLPREGPGGASSPPKLQFKRWAGDGPLPPRPKGPPPAHLLRKRRAPGAAAAAGAAGAGREGEGPPEARGGGEQEMMRSQGNSTPQRRGSSGTTGLGLAGSMALSTGLGGGGGASGGWSGSSGQDEGGGGGGGGGGAAGAGGSRELGGGWSEHYDAEAEAWYYYHGPTGEATWVPPDLAAAVDGKSGITGDGGLGQQQEDIWQQFEKGIEATPTPDVEDGLTLL